MLRSHLDTREKVARFVIERIATETGLAPDASAGAELERLLRIDLARSRWVTLPEFASLYGARDLGAQTDFIGDVQSVLAGRPVSTPPIMIAPGSPAPDPVFSIGGGGGQVDLADAVAGDEDTFTATPFDPGSLDPVPDFSPNADAPPWGRWAAIAGVAFLGLRILKG